MAINLFIVDDSATARAGLKALLSHCKQFKVIDVASNPLIAIKKMQLKRWPDVIISDLVMPEMDGVSFLQYLNQHRPTPFIVFSNHTSDNRLHSVDALIQGAIDVIAKPDFTDSNAIKTTQNQLTEAILGATTQARSNALFHAFRTRKASRQQPSELKPTKQLKPVEVVAIGSSTGGTTLIEKLLSHASPLCPPILVVQHMPADFTETFAKRINQYCQIHVKEAEDNEVIQQGTAYIAKGGLHMIIKRTVHGDKINLIKSVNEDKHAPSVDKLMLSIADIYYQRAIGIVLTGMGKDGAQGLLSMRNHGAMTIAQHKNDCAVYGMPKAAVEVGAATFQYTTKSIIELISSIQFKACNLPPKKADASPDQ